MEDVDFGDGFATGSFMNVERLRRWASQTFTLDVRSLALFRIGLGVLVFVDAVTRLQDVEVFYSDLGVRPRPAQIGDWMMSRPSLHLLSGSTTYEGVLLALMGAFGLLLALGWHTRVVSLLAWALVLSVQNRNNAVNSGADSVLVTLCLFACFLPVAARCSLDHRAGRATTSTTLPANTTTNALLTTATGVFVVQMVIIYIFNVFNKYGGTWWNGTAVLAALHLDQHATPIGLFMRSHMRWASAPLTFGTLFIETCSVLLLLPVKSGRLRTGLVVAFFALHAGMATGLYLGLFAPICMVAWTAMLPAWAWERPPLRSLARFFDAPATTTATWARWRSRAATVFLLWMISTQLILNTLKTPEIAPPDFIQKPARPLRFDQLWRLFSKNPSRHDGWSIVAGTLKNGEVVDLLAGGGPLSWEKPAVVADIYKNARWRKFMMNNSVAPERASRAKHARWFCQRWNDDKDAVHDEDHQLERVDMTFMLETTRRDFGLRPAVVPEDMGHFPCPGVTQTHEAPQPPSKASPVPPTTTPATTKPEPTPSSPTDGDEDGGGGDDAKE